MTSRLSRQDSLRAYDAGLYHIRQEPATSKNRSITSIDLERVLAQPNHASIIPTLPARELYVAVKQRGLQESLAVLEHTSREQVQRFCDYETWQDDRLDSKKLLEWMVLFRTISPEQMFTRFSQLDEEYQIACLAPLIRCYDLSAFEELSADIQDRLCSFPGNELFYEVLSEDIEIIKAVEELIATTMSQDMAYAMSLVSHASYTVPGEAEHLVYQFRTARIEEDGFVASEEARSIFYPIDTSTLMNKWRQSTIEPSTTVELDTPHGSFLQAVLAHCQQIMSSEEVSNKTKALIHLANTLAAATQIEPDDLPGMRLLMSHTASLVSTGLECLSDNNPSRAATILAHEHPRVLLQTSLSLVRDLQSDVIAGMERIGFDGASTLRRHWTAQRFAAQQEWFDQQAGWFGLQTTEILKAFFNRFPMVPKHQDDISEGSHQASIIFEPISGLADLYKLIIFSDILTAKLLLLHVNDFDKSTDRDLDELVDQTIKRSTDGPSSTKELNEDQRQAFVDRSIQYLRDHDDWYKGFSVSLRTPEQSKVALENAIRSTVLNSPRGEGDA